MALRLANKINRQFVKDVCRSFSAKREGVPDLEPALQKAEDVSKSAESSTPPLASAIASMPLKYEVCRPRTGPITPFQHSVQNETDVAKKTMAMQHLQPAMLPEYYKPPIEINSSCMYIDQLTESDKQSSSKRFEESKTCKNVTLPLKKPKLASPFPEPVKIMPSHTVSDQEKAELMLAEAKTLKTSKNTSKQQQKQQTSVRSTPQHRNYSTNNDKCKKLNEKKEKQCVHLRAPGCVPPKSISCKRRSKQEVQCVKKQSPYPSYSETCHEEPYNKPSECKICPYTSDENPHFKAPRTKFHTYSAVWAPKKTEFDGEINETVQQDSEIQKQSVNRQQMTSAPLIEGTNRPDVLLNEQETTSAVKTTRKPQTTFLNCNTEPRQDKKETEKKETQQIHLGKTQQESLGTLNEFDSKDESPPIDSAVYLSEEKSKCQKFPFKHCTFPIITERKPRPHEGQCPKKERPKLIIDCPSEKDDGKCKRAVDVNTSLRYLLADEEDRNGDEPRKCPKVDLGVFKDPKDYDEDPCRRKRKGTTLNCPEDLLERHKRKRKPKKKTSGPAVPIGQIPSRPSKSNTSSVSV